jgi:hypothetical protein
MIFTIVAALFTPRKNRQSGRDGHHRPFTPGALRGGSHVHVFSPNGENVSFTYNDHVMHELDPAQDLRNVGVAVPFGPVHPRSPIHASMRGATGACW